MCLILFSFQQHNDYPLVLTANRDEFYRRPTQPAHWWPDSSIFAGRDLQAMGTWLGITRYGRFAAITNVREAGKQVTTLRSRGELTRDYLESSASAPDYLRSLQDQSADYAGFNLLVGDHNELWFYSNRQEEIQQLQPGLYGISNGRFDEPWPKLVAGKHALARQLQTDVDTGKLADILFDSEVYPDQQLPQTGVPLEWERLLSSRFIQSDSYGTRASTVVTINNAGQVEFVEQNFAADGTMAERVKLQLQADQKAGRSSD